jgi:hypothetical protein
MPLMPFQHSRRMQKEIFTPMCQCIQRTCKTDDVCSSSCAKFACNPRRRARTQPPHTHTQSLPHTDRHQDTYSFAILRASPCRVVVLRVTGANRRPEATLSSASTGFLTLQHQVEVLRLACTANWRGSCAHVSGRTGILQAGRRLLGPSSTRSALSRRVRRS